MQRSGARAKRIAMRTGVVRQQPRHQLVCTSARRACKEGPKQKGGRPPVGDELACCRVTQRGRAAQHEHTRAHEHELHGRHAAGACTQPVELGWQLRCTAQRCRLTSRCAPWGGAAQPVCPSTGPESCCEQQPCDAATRDVFAPAVGAPPSSFTMMEVDAPKAVDTVYNRRPSSTAWLGRGDGARSSPSLSCVASSKSDSACCSASAAEKASSGFSHSSSRSACQGQQARAQQAAAAAAANRREDSLLPHIPG